MGVCVLSGCVCVRVCVCLGVHAFFIRKLVMLLVLDFLKFSANSNTKTFLKLS